MTSGLTYPYTKHDRVLGPNLDHDLEFNPSPSPPSGTAGGAGRFKYWVDNTDVNNGILRQCVVTRATAGAYVSGEWITLGVIDAANHKFHFNPDNVDFTGGSGALTITNLTVTGATHLNTLDVSGATNLNTLSVGGATTLNTLSVGGATSVTGGLTVSGAITGATLSISGDTNLNTLEVAGATSLHSATVNGDLTTSGTTTTNALVVTTLTTPSGLLTLANLTVSGLTTLNDLAVGGNTTLNAVSVFGNLQVAGNTTVTGQITGSLISSSGQVTGAEVHSAGVITGTAITGSTLNSSGNLTVSGDAVISGNVRAPAYFIHFSGVDYTFATIGHDIGIGANVTLLVGPEYSGTGAARIAFYDNHQSYYKADAHTFFGETGVGPTIAVLDTSATSNISGSWNVISDDSVKENVVPYDKGLAEILTLNPVSFNYYVPSASGVKWSPFADPQGTTTPTVHYGMMASNVEAVLPEMVATIAYSDIEQGLPGTPLKTIAPTHLVYVLTNAVKELAAQNAPVTDGSEAAAGQIGEYIVVSNTTGIASASDVPTQVCMLSLTAGDWEVWGCADFKPPSNVSPNMVASSVSIHPDALPNEDDLMTGIGILNMFTTTALTSGQRQVLMTGQCRSNTAGPIDLYLISQTQFSGSSTVLTKGYICARRVR